MKFTKSRRPLFKRGLSSDKKITDSVFGFHFLSGIPPFSMFYGVVAVKFTLPSADDYNSRTSSPKVDSPLY
jgi:hypothetical protein